MHGWNVLLFQNQTYPLLSLSSPISLWLSLSHTLSDSPALLHPPSIYLSLPLFLFFSLLSPHPFTPFRIIEFLYFVFDHTRYVPILQVFTGCIDPRWDFGKRWWIGLGYSNKYCLFWPVMYCRQPYGFRTHLLWKWSSPIPKMPLTVR